MKSSLTPPAVIEVLCRIGDRRLKSKKKGKKRKGYGGKAKRIPQVDSKQLCSRIGALAGPLCEYEGIELVHVEHQRESWGSILRIYIDRTPSVTMEDCASISRQLGDLLAIELEDIGLYSLEVSSPGLDRPLSREEDFERFEGEGVQLKTVHPIDGKSDFKGVLAGISLGMVKLMIEDTMVAIPYPEIEKARLVHPFDEPPGPDEDR
jgi:ribosome maturation factor RimP